MKELVKSNETENKPKNVEEAIKAGWKTAEEMYTTANSSRRTWDNFIADVRNAISQKSNSSCAIDCTTKNCITGAHNIKYYHPKVEEAFQAWLMKNQANQGIASATIKEATTQAVEKDWYSKQELAIEFGVDPKTIQRIVNEQITLDRPVQTKKGGYNNSEIFYNKDVYNMITAELAKHNTNQNTGIIQKQMSTVAAEAGLVKETDYAERIYGEDCFPTTMISESGIDKIYNCYDR